MTIKFAATATPLLTALLALSNTGIAQIQSPNSDPKVIYGQDDRVEIYQETDGTRLALSASVCALISTSQIVDNGNGTWTIFSPEWRQFNLPACSDEPFGDQPVPANCTGFLVSEDIVATAGHCYTSGSINSQLFVFGFDMLDATTPVLVVPDANVYRGAEVLGRSYESSLADGDDYTVVRLERIVTTPGAVPLPIRRQGVVQNGTPIGVIGHPAGLPKKIAFGDRTAVADNSPVKFFFANLDTYGGNSGSPVFNAITHVVEGILVTGEQDYVSFGSCFRSNLIPDSGAGEGVSKTTRFAQFIPEPGTGAGFKSTHFQCDSTIDVVVRDTNAAASSLVAQVSTAGGDLESVTLTDPDNDDLYTGFIPTDAANATIVQGDGVIQGNGNDTITIVYNDPSGPEGPPVVRTATAALDCEAPVVTNIRIASLADRFTVLFDTNEPVSAVLKIGNSCDALFTADTTALGQENALGADGLNPGDLRRFSLIVTDAAGNVTIPAGPGGACLYAQTSEVSAVPFEDDFDPAAQAGWVQVRASGSDDFTVVADAGASSAPNVYRLGLTTSSAQDIALVSPVFSGGDALEFKHSYSIEEREDGAVLEISTDGGSNWIDLEDSIANGPYNSFITLADTPNGALAGRACWAGVTTGMTTVTVDLADYPGNKQVRFRFVSKAGNSTDYWNIDDVRVVDLELPAAPLGARDTWEFFR